jgi:hypothetical protein
MLNTKAFLERLVVFTHRRARFFVNQYKQYNRKEQL